MRETYIELFVFGDGKRLTLNCLFLVMVRGTYILVMVRGTYIELFVFGDGERDLH